MEEVEAYLSDLDAMWDFVMTFATRSFNLFRVDEWTSDYNAGCGVPLVANFFVESYRAMPSIPLLYALADEIGYPAFDMVLEVMPAFDTDIDPSLCYYQLRIDYAKGLYTISPSE